VSVKQKMFRNFNANQDSTVNYRYTVEHWHYVKPVFFFMDAVSNIFFNKVINKLVLKIGIFYAKLTLLDVRKVVCTSDST
jgi:hypothetical protein